MAKTRVLVLSDVHCGHVVGLTPPQWWFRKTGEKYHDKYTKIQRQMWKFFETEIANIKPIHRVIFNGDAIEGKGLRSGGTELITSDRIRQGEMFRTILEEIDCTDVAMTYGTPSHTGTDEDMEDVIEKVLKKDFNISIGSHFEKAIAGVRFDARHFISSSGIPHGRYTPLAREDLWRLLWAERSNKPAPQVILRGHVHYHVYCGNEFSLMMTLPCLQGLGSKFGSRMCSGTVSLGFVYFDVEDGQYTWQSRIIPLAQQVSQWKEW